MASKTNTRKTSTRKTAPVVTVAERIACELCGKTLTREQSQDLGRGHRCDTLMAAGWTGERLQTHYAAITRTEIPDGYIKVAELDKAVKAARATVPGITVSKMVKAIGRDRAVEGPLHEIARPIYDARKHRWVNGWLKTKAGLQAIASGDFSKAPTK